MKLNLSILIAAIFILMLIADKSYLGVTCCICLSALNKCVRAWVCKFSLHAKYQKYSQFITRFSSKAGPCLRAKDLPLSTNWAKLHVSMSAVELQPTYCSQGILGSTSLQKSGNASGNRVYAFFDLLLNTLDKCLQSSGRDSHILT